MKNIRMPLIILALMVFPTALWAQRGIIQIQVKGISCPFCVYGVEKELKQIPGVESVSTNYKQSVVTVQKEESSQVNMGALKKAITDAGFTVGSISLTVTGVLQDWNQHPALKDSTSGQLFLLVEADKTHRDEFISKGKFEELKTLSRGGKKLLIEGKAHGHVDMPIAIEVTRYEAMP